MVRGYVIVVLCHTDTAYFLFLGEVPKQHYVHYQTGVSCSSGPRGPAMAPFE